MSKKNYSKMYSAEETQVAPVEETTAVEEQPVEVPVEVKEPKNAKGVVHNCGRLNVREHPSIDADVLCVLPAGTEVTVDMSNSYGDWYHVSTENGFDGFCMMKYIRL